MLKHIVTFKIQKEIKDKNIVINTFKDRLESLKNKIPQLKKLETGININKRSNAFHPDLVTKFDDEHDLEIYRYHRYHKHIVAFFQEQIADVVEVDYLK